MSTKPDQAETRGFMLLIDGQEEHVTESKTDMENYIEENVSMEDLAESEVIEFKRVRIKKTHVRLVTLDHRNF